MGNIFAASEVVELGIQIEINGREFYDTLRKQSKNPSAKDVFKFLASEEERHIFIFEKILEGVKKYEPQETYPGEYFAYMNALAGGYVFTQKDKGKEIAEKTNNDKEAIGMGMGFEKESILFYEGIKKVVPICDHKIIEELIIQEQSHLRQLVDLKAKL